MSKTYNANSILALSDIEGIRKRPTMYIGSVGQDGVHHLVKEVVNNSIDEFLNGFGSLIKVTIGKDNSISIDDYGRGMPVGINTQGIEAFEASVTMTHAGGKFNNNGESGYNTSGGLNGVGLKAVNALSDKAVFTSYTNGYAHTLVFERGLKIGDMKKTLSTVTGTTVTFKPDSTIFTETIETNYDFLYNMLKEFSYLTKGLEFVLDYKGKKESFKSELGLLDYINDINKDKKILTDAFYMDNKSEIGEVEMAMAINDSSSLITKLYTNNIPNSEGKHLTGFKTALTRVVNKYAKENKLIKDSEENFIGEDLQEGLSVIISLKMVEPIFSGQTKERLDDNRGRTIVEKAFGENFAEWLKMNPSQAKIIISKAQLSKKARLAAKRARASVVKKAKTVLASNLQGKVSECISKNVDETEIFLVEGDSAAGSAKMARDRQTQAILSLRGKILNAEKNDATKLLKNKEIQTMINAIGCNYGKDFKYSGLRYGKVIIMTDADVDGSHIRTLILTFFYRYMPELIENGNVFIAMAPLYKVSWGKQFKYLLDDNELKEFRSSHSGNNFELTYFKGLGELDSDELRDTTLSKENRRLKQVTLKDAKRAEKVIQDLMGQDATVRKVFFEKNAHRASVDA